MRSLFVLTVVVAFGARAQTTTTVVPAKHIPSTVLLELRVVENQFDLGLVRDCAPERCVSKGCVYRDHVVVDLPRNTSLPGLGHSEGLGSVPAQEYLTAAHCEFAHEKSVSARDVQALVKRLEQRLSKGWLHVTVGRQLLEPVSEGLRDSPLPKPEPAPVEAKAPPPTPAVPQKWDGEVATRELWLTLLPHFWWMLGIGFVSISAFAMIWAARRVGRESIEEKAMLAQLAAGALPGGAPAVEATVVPEPAALGPGSEIVEDAEFVASQQKRWAERVAKAELSKSEDVVAECLRAWLKAGEFPLLAKAGFSFGDSLSLAFPSDGEFAARKVEFADFLRTLDPKSLPSDAAFFRSLNQHAISSSLLAQSDADIYLSLHEEFGGLGMARLIERLPPQQGARLFGMVPGEVQDEVARALAPEWRGRLVSHLLFSNRISAIDRSYLFEVVQAARGGRALPAAPKLSADTIVERGQEFDAAGALSVLLPYLPAEGRTAQFTEALTRAHGGFPQWYEDILFPDMLLKLPEETRADLLLEVDLAALAGWISLQPAQVQHTFIAQVPSSLQRALHSSLSFPSREEQLRLARRGRHELVAAMKRLFARGQESFAGLVA
jgi:hypothetical protein